MLSLLEVARHVGSNSFLDLLGIDNQLSRVLPHIILALVDLLLHGVNILLQVALVRFELLGLHV